MSKELKQKAIELGIENAEALTASQLKKAIEAAQAKLDAESEAEQAKIDASDNLRKTAVELELPIDGLTDEEILEAINQEGQRLLEEKAEQVKEQLLDTLSEYLGVEDIRVLDVETVKTLLAEKEVANASNIEVVIEEEVTELEEGKTDESYTDSKGREWVFTEDAPSAFRCLGIERTQKEWMEDADSMELFVQGDLSFIKPLKK